MSTPMMDTAAAQAAGVQLEDEVFEDYFGFDDEHVWYFPDGKQFIQFKAMTEGKKARFQNATNKDVVVERASGNARMKVDPASERQELIKASVTGWHIMRRQSDRTFVPVPYSDRALVDWMNNTNPKLVADLEAAIRKANPWLLADQSSEEIRKEIDNLEEAYEAAVKRESGEGPSATKCDNLVRGNPIENAYPEIRLFILCESMKWAHLPVAGGLYDQHPKLITRWQYIFAKRAEHDAEERRREESKRGSKAPRGRPMAGRRR